MATVSISTADNVQDHGSVRGASSEVGGYTIDFVMFREPEDITGLLSSLSHGKCMCPHFGYLLSGRLHVRYDDGREETVEAGDAFYLPAGHTSWRAEAGTEMVQFSPTAELAEVNAAIVKMMQARAGAAS